MRPPLFKYARPGRSRPHPAAVFALREPDVTASDAAIGRDNHDVLVEYEQRFPNDVWAIRWPQTSSCGSWPAKDATPVVWCRSVVGQTRPAGIRREVK